MRARASVWAWGLAAEGGAKGQWTRRRGRGGSGRGEGGCVRGGWVGMCGPDPHSGSRSARRDPCTHALRALRRTAPVRVAPFRFDPPDNGAHGALYGKCLPACTVTAASTPRQVSFVSVLSRAPACGRFRRNLTLERKKEGGNRREEAPVATIVQSVPASIDADRRSTLLLLCIHLRAKCASEWQGYQCSTIPFTRPGFDSTYADRVCADGAGRRCSSLPY